jgi:hypothetical protein
MVHGKFKVGKLSYAIALMDPDWTADQDRQGYDVFGRATASPISGLSFGVGGGHKAIELGARTVHANALGVDAQLKAGGLFLLAEGLLTELAFEAETPWAYSGVLLASYDIALAADLSLQPVAFVEYVDANSEFAQTEAVRFVVGSNLLVTEHMRIMPQAEWARPVGHASTLNPWEEATAYYLMLALDL